MPNSWWEKKSEEDEQTLEESNSAHRRSQPKWQLVQTSYFKRVKLLLFLPYIKHLINRAKSICMGESWPRSCVQTSLRSICTYDLGQDLALINRAGGLYGRILTEVVSTDRTQWGLYTRPRSRFSHTDRLSSVNKMFIIWRKQEKLIFKFSFNVTGLH